MPCGVEGQDVLATSALPGNVPEDKCVCVCVSKTALSRSGEQGPMDILACLSLGWRCEAQILFNFPRLLVNTRFAGVSGGLDSGLNPGDLTHQREAVVSITRVQPKFSDEVGYVHTECSENSGERIMNSSRSPSWEKFGENKGVSLNWSLKDE